MSRADRPARSRAVATVLRNECVVTVGNPRRSRASAQSREVLRGSLRLPSTVGKTSRRAVQRPADPSVAEAVSEVVPLPDGYKAAQVRSAIAADLARLPPTLRKTLTWDRGREMAEHQELAADLGMGVYFCDPRSPWQRGSNENTNRLLRQYLAKGADLRQFTAADLAGIADRINTRPRRVLDWATAAEAFLPHLKGPPAITRQRLEPPPATGQSPENLKAFERR